MRNSFALKLLCCFCLSVWCVFATPMRLKAEIIKPDVHHITTKSGLSHPHVYQSFQDSRGIMWFVTANGLNVYDGSSFHKAMDWGTQYALGYSYPGRRQVGSIMDSV